MKARAADVKDISDRLVRVLSGHGEGELMHPNQLSSLLRIWHQVKLYRWIRARFLHLLQERFFNSHTAILARTMNIPALINIEYDETMDGKMAVVDGKSGNLIVEPDADTLKKYEDRKPRKLHR